MFFLATLLSCVFASEPHPVVQQAIDRAAEIECSGTDATITAAPESTARIETEQSAAGAYAERSDRENYGDVHGDIVKANDGYK